MLVQDIYQQQEVQDTSTENSEEQEITPQPVTESVIWSMAHGKIFLHWSSHTSDLSCCILRLVFRKRAWNENNPVSKALNALAERI